MTEHYPVVAEREENGTYKTTSAKADAARRNGRKGGRPRKAAVKSAR